METTRGLIARLIAGLEAAPELSGVEQEELRSDLLRFLRAEHNLILDGACILAARLPVCGIKYYGPYSSCEAVEAGRAIQKRHEGSLIPITIIPLHQFEPGE